MLLLSVMPTDDVADSGWEWKSKAWWGGESLYTSELVLLGIYMRKPSLSSFYEICFFIQKNHPSYGKEHSVKFLPLYI